MDILIFVLIHFFGKGLWLTSLLSSRNLANKDYLTTHIVLFYGLSGLPSAEIGVHH